MIFERVLQEVSYEYYLDKFNKRRKGRDEKRFGSSDMPVVKKFKDGSLGLFGRNKTGHYKNYKDMVKDNDSFLISADKVMSDPKSRRMWQLQNKLYANRGKLAVAGGGLAAAGLVGYGIYKHRKNKKKKQEENQ